jgi:hypothetical protein
MVAGAPYGSVVSADWKHTRVPDESCSPGYILGVPSGAMTVSALASAEISSVRGSRPHAETTAMQARPTMQALNGISAE